ncbi:hypothetical protein LH991_15240 [Schleiferilactobacillus harbinensis]|uniref:hypothetical protein n=1 Tax=Schleiferilactobacillus harbinensis TaxID=304207 RepID=UPI001265E8FE|nr:hypothetical protein [Schleiferilactobacillus harbinensis]QFR65194.1 hypothetical protein LH991_15240 [Schleiferilactobacillus harbinensis]
MQEIRHFLIGNFLHFTAGVNILLLSLLGWFILCVLVVPIFWVVPYAQTLFAAYYAALREQKPDLIPIPV